VLRLRCLLLSPGDLEREFLTDLEVLFLGDGDVEALCCLPFVLLSRGDLDREFLTDLFSVFSFGGGGDLVTLRLKDKRRGKRLGVGRLTDLPDWLLGVAALTTPWTTLRIGEGDHDPCLARSCGISRYPLLFSVHSFLIFGWPLGCLFPDFSSADEI